MNSEFPPFAEIEIICKFLLEKCAHIRVLTSHQQEGELGRGQGAACSSFDSDFTISEMHYKSIFHQLIQQVTDNRSCRFSLLHWWMPENLEQGTYHLELIIIRHQRKYKTHSQLFPHTSKSCVVNFAFFAWNPFNLPRVVGWYHWNLVLDKR